MWWLRNSIILFGVGGEKSQELRSHHHFLLGNVSHGFVRHAWERTPLLIFNTVFIGEEDTMVNKIVVVDKIVHLGPPLSHCRGLLYKIVW